MTFLSSSPICTTKSQKKKFLQFGNEKTYDKSPKTATKQDYHKPHFGPLSSLTVSTPPPSSWETSSTSCKAERCRWRFRYARRSPSHWIKDHMKVNALLRAFSLTTAAPRTSALPRPASSECTKKMMATCRTSCWPSMVQHISLDHKYWSRTSKRILLSLLMSALILSQRGRSGISFAAPHQVLETTTVSTVPLLTCRKGTNLSPSIRKRS